ncbi:AraC family transcriptional regulator [Massilibacteroides sp.]|uniref:AraC family transcriptional regulator n=1 Tax=Massilibacteroides sp. TaxID=2034766 RepID=UPI00260EA9A1|nr:AraC family transcriptional regulator [Massilibacteroides sp.]MDD4516495.1 AraC family transcriptional regulator [Massilibacteroides sp.]
MEQLFTILGFTEEKARRMATFAFEPHTHDFEELVICKTGRIEHLIDFERSTLTAPLISFISKGKTHTIQMLPDEKGLYPSGWILRFKSSIISESRFQLYSDYHDYANLELSPGENFERLCSISQMIESEMNNANTDYAVIRSLLSALFVLIESERKKRVRISDGAEGNQSQTFKAFLRILEDNFRRNVSVDFYAEKLNMSARNLNLICRNILQRSVSEIIETRKLTEAKNLLMHSDKSISEIGYELGYNEKAYFTKVFKKKAGMTPTEFKAEIKKML